METKENKVTVPGWEEVVDFINERFASKAADVKSILFIIGMREMGTKKTKYTKEEKQDLMNLAICRMFGMDGYFDLTHMDAQGWPMYTQTKPLPTMDKSEQEAFIMGYIVRYFRMEGLIKGSEK